VESMGVMECVTESNTCGMSWKGITEINICLASRKRCQGKRHGNSEVRSVMERRHGKRCWWSVMEKPSWNASWKQRDAQRHGKALRKPIVVEHHGIVVTECVTQKVSDRRMQHFRNVMEKSSWTVPWKATSVKRHGKASRKLTSA